MKSFVQVFLMLFFTTVSFAQVTLYKDVDKNLSLLFLLDSYYSYDLGSTNDNSPNINARILSPNMPFNNEFRINVMKFNFNYEDKNVRAKFGFQYGDIPLLTAPPEKAFIRNIASATFGFDISKQFKFDAGYMGNPIGYEGTDPFTNHTYSVSVAGYMQPGKLLGAKISYIAADNLDFGLLIGNSYNLISANNTNKSAIFNINYSAAKSLKLSYAVQVGDEALKGDASMLQVYHNLQLHYDASDRLSFSAQIDFSSQKNSKNIGSLLQIYSKFGSETAYMYSSVISCKYLLSSKFSWNGRVEYFDDPDGFISNGAGDSGNKLKTYGFSTGLAFNPYNSVFIRVEYSYLKADQDLFYEKKDNRSTINIGAGIKL